MAYRLRIVTLTISMLAAVSAAGQVPVEVETVSVRQVVQQINVTGTVTSPRSAVLSTAVSGIVAELSADEGDRVTTGETLLKLDAELARLALERARADVQQREIAAADAKRRFDEAEKVAARQVIARTQVESLRAEVSGEGAALAAAQAAAREQRAIVERHTLKAAFTGVIGVRYTELGEWVNPGDPLFDLVATDNLRFDFRVGQDNFAALTPDTPVDITLDAFPENTISGHVDTIVPIKNPNTRTFLVRVATDAATADSGIDITPGMSARGRLNVDVGRRAVTVSRDAILRFPDGRVTVWVVNTDSDLKVVSEQVVSLGAAFDGLVEVSNGLSEGDVVVVRGNEVLQEGQSVSIIDSEG